VAAVAEGFTSGHRPLESFPTSGRYGLALKEFTPAMIKSIFEELNKEKPRNHFTIGIKDDVTNTSLDYDPLFLIEDPDTVRSILWTWIRWHSRGEQEFNHQPS
jgi:pyruvate-ferredoxin/flavodoxin oxidoreductase